MKESPILFSGEMVRAILDGRKTVTRRVVKPQPMTAEKGRFVQWTANKPVFTWKSCEMNYPAFVEKCPYGQPGDRLTVSMEIPGFPSYCAGSDGVIYSKARGEWRPLSAHGGNPYPTVTVMDGRRKTTRAVHSLVCTAFYGTPAAGLQVRHLDGNPANNWPLNLAWGTQEENWLDRKAHGNGIEGEKHHAALFSDEERRWINWIVGKGIASQRHVARVLGVAQSSVWEIINHNTFPPPKQEIPDGRIPRITLEVTGVRVERVQDIDEMQAMKEGAPLVAFKEESVQRFHRNGFRQLWDTLNASRGFGWDKNPWVWVVEFKRIS